MKIYCVEDDDSIRELIVYTLNRSEHNVEGFAAAGQLEIGRASCRERV